MSIDEQPMNVYWGGKRTETVNKFKTDFKGSVEEYTDLPSEGNKKGDMYNVIEDSNNYIWDGESWSKFALDIDSALSLESENPLQNKVITNALSKKINIANGVNWQKSEKAGAVAIYPMPETVLEPIVDFLFTETPPASGDKGPENPSTIAGVTQAKVTRCGKNLIKSPYYQQSGGDRGITYTVNQDGSITANGTATALTYFYVQNLANSPFLHEGVQYTLSGCPAGGSTNTYFLRIDHTDAPDTGSTSSFTVESSGIPGNVAIVVKSGTTVSNLVFRPQLELGSTATSFEPYSGADYTVNLGGTFYGGSVDLSTGTMTVTWWANVFNGTENWQKGSNSTESINEFLLTTSGVVLPMSATISSSTRYCSHFPFSSSLSSNTFYTWGGTPRIIVYRPVSEIADVAAFKAWLAEQYTNGTPVVVVYRLASPQTAILTPTQILALPQPDKYVPRLNTVYSDQESVQVGYIKSPIRTEYELTQAIIATEGGE